MILGDGRFAADINATLVLSLIGERPISGFGLVKKIAACDHGCFSYGEAQIYPLLHLLEKEHLVKSSWQDQGGCERKVYVVTALGSKTLESSRLEWQRLLHAFKSLLKPTGYNSYGDNK